MLVRSGQYQLGTKIKYVDIWLSKGYLLKNNKNKNYLFENLLFDDIFDIRTYLCHDLTIQDALRPTGVFNDTRCIQFNKRLGKFPLVKDELPDKLHPVNTGTRDYKLTI